MIKSLLIANRGEIAVRIARTAKKMGVKTYGVRTKKEPQAIYLNFVDVILNFPDIDSSIPEFLDIDNLVELAQSNKVEAIHPGYGYLSENAGFAQKCKDAGIIFIGPSAEVIQMMGDKITAKEIAAKSNVPMLGGSAGSVSDAEKGVEIANKIGYPVIIKAASGGGGRGMRIVRSANDMAQMFKMASSEALNAFNDPSVFIEKYLENPKHVEVQIVADNFGNVIHLGERECSVQRKHQKMLEEAPSPALNSELREKMAEAAITLAKSVNYQSLGTVEFLLDKSGNFYFMEMNTRIQVEHPVTEMITGLDLVKLQLEIASNQPLSVKQEDVKLKGWSIECRINAEDVQANFTPCMGLIKNIRFPSIKGVRIDTGIAAGSEITPFFDSMVAKLIVHADSRAKAIELALEALQQFNVKGVKTTVPFCKAVLHNEVFRSGAFDTSFIEKDLGEPVYREENEEFLAALLSIYTYNHENTPIIGAETSIDPWVLNKRIRNL